MIFVLEWKRRHHELLLQIIQKMHMHATHILYCPKDAPACQFLWVFKILHVTATMLNSCVENWKQVSWAHVQFTAKTNWLFQPLRGYPDCRQPEETVVMYCELFANCIRQPERTLHFLQLPFVGIVTTEHASSKEVTQHVSKSKH